MDRQLHNLVKSYCELESIGKSNKINFDTENSRALEILEKACSFKENTWEVGLFWKTDNAVLPNSKGNAFHRLKLIEKMLYRHQTQAKINYREMDRLFENRYAEIVEETAIEPEHCWYIPHFGVTSEN